MSSTIFLKNANIRHQIFLQRFAGGEVKDLNKAVDRSMRLVIAGLKANDPTNITDKQLKKFMSEIRDATNGIYKEQTRKTLDSIKEFTAYESEFAARGLDQAVETEIALPSKRDVNKAVFGTPMAIGDDKGASINKALLTFGRKKAGQLNKVIRDGIVGGQTTPEIISKIRDVSTGLQRNHASAIVRTITNHVASVTRSELAKSNKDIVQSEVWTSVLDGNTTSICQSLDGKEFPIGIGPRPPAHWGCRSVMTFKIKKEHDVLPGLKTKRFARGSEGRESVSGKTTYNSWLKTQPKSFQEEVLGTTKAKLFRDGNLPVTKFVDKKFQPLTLDQLRRKEPLAFDKAGLT